MPFDQWAADFISTMSPERIMTTVLSGLTFGFVVLGGVLQTPQIAEALANVKYGTQIAKSAFAVLMVFTVPPLLLSLVGLDGPTGRAVAGIPLAAILCVGLDVGVRLRIRWTKRTRWRRSVRRVNATHS